MLDSVLKKAKMCRAFEVSTFDQIKQGNIKIPVYLSAGQEMISCAISTYCESINVQPLIFAQHRAHSIYLSFGGDSTKLIDELLGLESGCAGGMGGSASIHCPEINMFGHDGLMGSNVPIGVGACFASKKPTIVFVGDAAGEEDYALSAYGWAATKNLPILFVVEDNNLSILTEKKVRRSWEIHNVTQSMGMESHNITDNATDILDSLCDWGFSGPRLLNVNTVRMFWHAGAGTDGETRDLLKDQDISQDLQRFEKLWRSRLEIQ
jgi:TPP-dependent pyruvate/acetoin dehydrogenase alpha subunit